MNAKYLITGAAGQLGRALLKRLGKDAIGYDLPDLDITEPDSVGNIVRSVDPQWIINCAAITDVDLCQKKPELAMKVHRDGVVNLAETGRRLVTISTDHVFTGISGQTRPFFEDDDTCPANIYGESKLLGEIEAVRADPGNIVIRTSWMFSATEGMIPFLSTSLLRTGYVPAVTDQIACMTYAPDIAEAIVCIIARGKGGLYHVTNPPGITPAEAARRLAGLVGGSVIETTWSDLDLEAPRPVYSALASTRGVELPAIWDAIENWRMIDVRHT